MKKFIIGILLAGLLGAHVGANSATSFAGNASDAGIVTPGVAVAVAQFTRYTYNADGGGMSVCYWENHTRNGCGKWTPIAQVVPSGRTYVGFRVVSGGSGYRMIEIYWK